MTLSSNKADGDRKRDVSEFYDLFYSESREGGLFLLSQI